MKLISKTTQAELDVKKYAMPVKGAAGTANINGEEVVTMYTAGRGKDYTYFRIKNVDLYIQGALAADEEFELELPEGFGSDVEPSARKSYYVRKRNKNPDGSVPAGGSDASEAPHTEVRDGVEVAVNPDGSLVSAEAQDATLHGEPLPGSVDLPTPESFLNQTGEQPPENDPDGQPIDEVASTAEAKKRSKRK